MTIFSMETSGKFSHSEQIVEIFVFLGCIDSAAGDLLTRYLWKAALPLTEFTLVQLLELVSSEQLWLCVRDNM